MQSAPARVLAVIPARGGSKGVPHKNIRLLGGRPLISYTIDAASGARLLDRTVVSTDDTEIAEIARQYGAETPFLRPAELARDESLAEPVLDHALGWLEEHESYLPDYVMLLQPTSPLRTAEDIDNAISLALEKDADGVVSVCPAKHHPYLIKRLGEDGQISDFLTLDRTYKRRQDLPPAFGLTGAIYMVKRDILLESHTFYTDRTYPYIMPVERSLDIDTLWDFAMAELILGAGASQDGI
jgi:N-acylneuraminate cytidylyltransferase/CMP-N,N'-diacetyllegionaminic acid synthase